MPRALTNPVDEEPTVKRELPEWWFRVDRAPTESEELPTIPDLVALDERK